MTNSEKKLRVRELVLELSSLNKELRIVKIIDLQFKISERKNIL